LSNVIQFPPIIPAVDPRKLLGGFAVGLAIEADDVSIGIERIEGAPYACLRLSRRICEADVASFEAAADTLLNALTR
jgi:hypothetical protein